MLKIPKAKYSAKVKKIEKEAKPEADKDVNLHNIFIFGEVSLSLVQQLDSSWSKSCPGAGILGKNDYLCTPIDDGYDYI